MRKSKSNSNIILCPEEERGDDQNQSFSFLTDQKFNFSSQLMNQLLYQNNPSRMSNEANEVDLESKKEEKEDYHPNPDISSDIAASLKLVENQDKSKISSSIYDSYSHHHQKGDHDKYQRMKVSVVEEMVERALLSCEVQRRRRRGDSSKYHPDQRDEEMEEMMMVGACLLTSNSPTLYTSCSLTDSPSSSSSSSNLSFHAAQIVTMKV